MTWQSLQAIKRECPLVMNITNFVVMNTTAHAMDEVVEMASLAAAVVINIGTLSPSWVDAMEIAGTEAKRKGIPVILDPVGSGATHYRTRTALRLIDAIQPAIIRCNASEARSLVRSDGGTKGVDTSITPDEALADAVALAASLGCVVSVSGPVDLIVGGGQLARVANGCPIMTRVTGMGCTASALTGAFAAADRSPFAAAVHAMTTMGVAGEIAARRSAGPGSFQVAFLDVLHGLEEQDLSHGARVTLSRLAG